MYDNELKAIALIIIGVIFLAAGLIFLGILTDKSSCYSRWADSGIQAKWSVMGNCQVNIEGNWIPEKRYFYKKEVE